MDTKTYNRPNYFEGDDLTDQSDKKNCDINHIMDSFLKTGVLPNSRITSGAYSDNLEKPQTLSEILDFAQQFREDFQSLPAAIRKAMNHDPKNFNAFISDPDNKDLLIEHGVLTEKKKSKPAVDVEPADEAVPKGKGSKPKEPKGDA